MELGIRMRKRGNVEIEIEKYIKIEKDWGNHDREWEGKDRLEMHSFMKVGLGALGRCIFVRIHRGNLEDHETLLFGFVAVCGKRGCQLNSNRVEVLYRGLTLVFILSEPAVSSRIDRVRTVGCSSNGSNAVLRTLITLIGGLDVPDVRLEGVTSTSDAHFSEVANSIFCLCEACLVLIVSRRLEHSIKASRYVPSSAALDAHSYASFSSFSRTGSAPTRYHAHRAIIANG